MSSGGLAPEIRFYQEALRVLKDAQVPFLVGGAFALSEYAGISRDTKDLDVFCKPHVSSPALAAFAAAGYDVELTDANWLGKATRGDNLVDIIFGSGNLRCQVDDSWFQHARSGCLWEMDVQLAPPEEIIWSKAYVQDRSRFDGADVLHILRKEGAHLDWKRLLARMEADWEILYAYLLTFTFVYPSERGVIPSWVWQDLRGRLDSLLAIPPSREPICRGPLLSRTQYLIDLHEWGYKEK